MVNGHSHSTTYHSGARAYGPSGEILIYQIDYTKRLDGTLELNTMQVYKTQQSAHPAMVVGAAKYKARHSMHQHLNATHGTLQFQKD